MTSKAPLKRKINKSKSTRAGLKFPIGRVHRFLRSGHFAPRVGNGAAIYLAAALEYLSTEILELATECASQNNKHRISPRHILIAIRKDDELDTMFKGVTISSAGVVPSIQPALLPKKTAKKKTAEE